MYKIYALCIAITFQTLTHAMGTFQQNTGKIIYITDIEIAAWYSLNCPGSVLIVHEDGNATIDYSFYLTQLEFFKDISDSHLGNMINIFNTFNKKQRVIIKSTKHIDDLYNLWYQRTILALNPTATKEDICQLLEDSGPAPYGLITKRDHYDLDYPITTKQP